MVVRSSIQFVSRIDDKVIVRGELGQGYTSVVQRVYDRQRLMECAMKVVSKRKLRSIARDNYYKDVLAQYLQIEHPNIVRIHQVYETFDAFYLMMDLCQGPDLVDFCLSYRPGGLPRVYVKRFFFQLLLGLHKIHSRRLLHRDIKLDNLMVDADESRIKIIDVDMSMFSNRVDGPHGRGPQAVVGTREYMAPECHAAIYNRRSDLWACGVVLYIMVDGHFPFNVKGTKEETQKRLMRPLNLRSKSAEDAEAWDLIGCLLRQPGKRSMFSAQDALDHPWFATQFLREPTSATTAETPDEAEATQWSSIVEATPQPVEHVIHRVPPLVLPTCDHPCPQTTGTPADVQHDQISRVQRPNTPTTPEPRLDFILRPSPLFQHVQQQAPLGRFHR